MKLSPPASSSDLEVARAIARRLDHRARGTEPGTKPTPAPPAPVVPPPAVARPGKRRTPERPSRPPEPVAPPSEAEQELTDPSLELEAPELESDVPELAASEFEPEPPEVSEPDPEPEPPELAAPELETELPELAEPEFEPEPPELKVPDPEPGFEPETPPSDTPEPPDLPDLEPSFEPEAPPEPLFETDVPGLTDAPSVPEDGLAPPPAYGTDTGEFQPGAPGVSGVEEGLLEQLPPGGFGPATGSFDAAPSEEPTFGENEISDEEDALAELAAPPAASELEDLGPPQGGVSPEDLLSEEPAAPGWSDPAALEAEVVGGEEAPQPEPEAPVAPPSPWNELADSCLALAPANGAMLVDPAGQVLTARGNWPEPGPEAIAGRLVSMMEKKLRDAPTRSVSAPLAGQHLTAWRVPSAEGYLTVVFMADAPLKADVRPAIDTVVQAAGG